jgi:hypothetical protein
MRHWTPGLIVLGVVLGLIGTVAPWIPHQAAGLRLNALDLFVVVRLLPPVRDGIVRVAREVFLLPLLVPAVLLALSPAFEARTRPRTRYLASGLGIVLALTVLPPYPPILTAWRDPLYRGQFFLVLGTCALALAALWARRLPERVLAGLTVGLALVGWLLPFLALMRVRPVFAAIYGAPVGIGLGALLSGLSALLLLAAGTFRIFLPRPDPDNRGHLPRILAHLHPCLLAVQFS